MSEISDNLDKAFSVSELLVDNAERVAKLLVAKSSKNSSVHSISDMGHAIEITKFVFDKYISNEEVDDMLRQKQEIKVIE